MIANHLENQGSSMGEDTPVRQPTPKQTPIVLQPSTRLTAIWDAAIKSYQDVTKIDIAEVSSAVAGNGRLTAVRLWESIDDEQSKFKEYRNRGTQMHQILMPLLDHIEIISKRTAGKTSWKPCETVFIAIKLLFDATGSHAGPFYENIIGVFQRLGSCVDMCNRVCWDFVNQTETITSGLRKRLADVLGQVLVIIGMLTVTKQKQKATFVQSFISHFSKRRVDLNPVSDALERLVYLTKFDNLVIRRDTKI